MTGGDQRAVARLLRCGVACEDIRDYWSLRAETYDSTPGHGVVTPREAAAWGRLIHAHFGPGMGRRTLDLGGGTDIMSLLMYGAGPDASYDVLVARNLW